MKEGWELKKLGEVCEVRGGATPLRSNELFWENGDIPWFTIDDIRDQGRIISSTKQKVTAFALKKLTLYPKNTVLLCCTASVGEYAITTIPLTSNQQFNGLTIKNINEIFPFFLFYYCSTLKEKLLSLSGKTTINFVSSAKIKDLDIFLPPLSEQQHIVEILDTAFEKIDTVKQNAERNLINAKELFQSVLDFELLPKNKWEEKKLSEICNLITDGTHSTPKYTEKGVPFLSVKNLTNGFIDFSETRFISEEEHKFLTKRCKPEQEDILYTKIGTTGIAQVIDTDKEFSIFVSVALLKVKRDIIYNYYLRHALNAPKAREQARKRTRGTANKNLVITDIKEITVPVPPISEQQQIVSKLDALSAKCKELENNYLQTINDCDELKKAILAKAFNGEL